MNPDLVDILKSVDELALRGKISRNRAFAAWYAINFHNIDEDDALEAAAADGGNDQGLDIVFVDESAEEIIILQAHCPEQFTKKTQKAKWDVLTALLPFVADPSKFATAGRPDISESLSAIIKAHPDFPISIGLASLGQRSEAIDASINAHRSQKAYPNFDYFYQAQEDIKLRYKALIEAEAGIPEDNFSFTSPPISDKGEYGRAWVGSVSATELKRLYNAHREKLFAGNIRLFLGRRKGGINEGIIKTAKESPGNFWALNNGITIVTDNATPISDKEDTTTLKLQRFSIVNGCQTTHSLVQADASASAKVLARVIAAKTGLANEIVRYNNSQNAVKIWTVRAVDDVQLQLRREFEKSKINYAPKQEGARKKKDPDIIELDKVTQFLASSESSFLLQAIDNKGELFDQPYQKIYNKNINATKVYLAWLAGNLAEEERQRYVQDLKEDANAGLLGVTSTYWIIFCTYKIIFKNCDVASPHMNLSKMKSVEFKNALRKYVSKAASMFYDAAIDTYDRLEYGSFKSTLRSAKFLSKIEGKMNIKLIKPFKELPNLAEVCKSAKGA